MNIAQLSNRQEAANKAIKLVSDAFPCAEIVHIEAAVGAPYEDHSIGIGPEFCGHKNIDRRFGHKLKDRGLG